jgi:hypothetical protein
MDNADILWEVISSVIFQKCKASVMTVGSSFVSGNQMQDLWIVSEPVHSSPLPIIQQKSRREYPHNIPIHHRHHHHNCCQSYNHVMMLMMFEIVMTVCDHLHRCVSQTWHHPSLLTYLNYHTQSVGRT